MNFAVDAVDVSQEEQAKTDVDSADEDDEMTRRKNLNARLTGTGPTPD